MTSAVTEKLGPYELLDRLGRGGMGLVYRAWDDRLHREVAIKLLRSEYPEPGMHERFLQEARAASALNHPNICTIFDLGDKDGTPYLVMELLQGQTLRARLEHSPIPVDEIVQFSREIADALGAAHARGIVHRDIKPPNIFLVERPNGGCQTKVLDFGLAKMEVPDGPLTGDLPLRTSHPTSDGETVGTVAYMSPEQARGESLDGRTDLFSLGVTMYEMATRRLPFPGHTTALAFVQLLNHPPEPIRDWNASVTRDLEHIILKLLEKDPADRFQTAADLIAALDSLTAASARPPKRAATPPPPPLPKHTHSSTSTSIAIPTLESTSVKRQASSITRLPAVPLPRSLPRLPIAQPTPADAAGGNGSDEIDPLLSLLRGSTDVRPAPKPTAEAPRAPGHSIEPLIPPPFLSDPDEDPASTASRRLRPLAVLALLLIVCAVVGAFFFLRAHLHPSPLLASSDRLTLAAIENRTGDPTLDGVAATALAIDLQQSPHLNLRTADYRVAPRQFNPPQTLSFRSAAEESASVAPQPPTSTDQAARQAAQSTGAKAYLYGTLTASGSAYTLSVEIRDTAKDRKLATAQATAPTRAQLTDAIDRIAAALRTGLRIDAASSGGAHGASPAPYVPLAREATANLDALHSYSLGETALLDGRTGDALAAFQSAVSLDPHFTQAQLQLASLYASQHAESAAASAARLANDSAANASARTNLLAQYAYEVDATGNLPHAAEIARQFLALYPLDLEGARTLAQTLRLQGDFAAALDAAQHGIAAAPSDAALYREAELSLIALDRYDDALALEPKSAQLAPHDDTALTAAYLAAKPDLLASSIERAARPPRQLASMAAYGLYLDDSGQFTAGETLWRATAAGTDPSSPDSSSTAAAPWLLAQGALDRALAGHCPAALDMAHAALAPAQAITPGPAATFNAGLAAALCGNKVLAQQAITSLSQNWPQSSAFASYLPDINAALALGQHIPPGPAIQAGLAALQPASPQPAAPPTPQSDLIAPYLRALTHLALHQPQLAIPDLQLVLAHRGATLTTAGDLYPMAQLALARAYAQTPSQPGTPPGATASSIQAYKQFLTLWSAADPSDRLLQEAMAASR